MQDKFKAYYGFCRNFLWQAREDNITGLAAQLAYYFLLSIFPFLIFMITLIGYTPLKTEDVLGLIKQYAPGVNLQIITQNIRSVLEQRNTGLLSFGIIAAVWSASNALSAMMNALDRAYKVEGKRSFLKARSVAVGLTFIMMFVILVALLLPVFGHWIGMLIFSLLEISATFLVFWEFFRWFVSFCVIILVFMIIYYFAPNKRLKIKEVTVGAIFTTVGWQAVSYAFSYYVNNFGNFSATYGSLGGIIILMVWFYLTALIIILGGELNAALHKSGEKKLDQ